MRDRIVEKSVKVGFAGLSHLGLVSCAAIAGAGFTTICYDNDTGLIERLRKGDVPVREPHLDNLLAANSTRLTFTSDLRTLGFDARMFGSHEISFRQYAQTGCTQIHCKRRL